MKLQIEKVENGFIVTYPSDSENEKHNKLIVKEESEVESVRELLKLINDLVGVSYNKFAESLENIFVIVAPGHKSDNFEKYHDLVYRKHSEN